jgi:hypothetical protein
MGGLQAEYRALVRPKVSDESCFARFAYATYLAGHEPRVWRRFADLALSGDLSTLTSTEIAWLLDLALGAGAGR